LKSGLPHKVVDDCELIVVPSGMQREIIKQAHDHGHFSVKKCKEIIGNEFYITKLEKKF